jgi:hypothetical protein
MERKPHKGWHSDEEAQLIDMRLKDVSLRTIANHLPGRSESACKQRLNMLLLKDPDLLRRLPQNNISKQLRLRAVQNKWSDDEEKTLKELRRNCLSYKDIAKHLPDRSQEACRLYQHRSR